MTNNSSEPFDQYVSDLIRHKAKALCAHPAFRNSQVEDLQQELALHLVKQRCKYDPRRASFHTFANRVLTNHSATLIRRRTAQRRDRRRERRLCQQNVPAGAQSDWQRVDRALDVAEAIGSLPQPLQIIAKQLQRLPTTAVQRELGLSRGQLRHRAKRIAEHFLARGVHTYRRPTATRAANAVDN